MSQMSCTLNKKQPNRNPFAVKMTRYLTKPSIYGFQNIQIFTKSITLKLCQIC